MQLWRGKRAELFFVLMKQPWKRLRFRKKWFKKWLHLYTSLRRVHVVQIIVTFMYMRLCWFILWFTIMWNETEVSCPDLALCGVSTPFQFQISLRTAFRFLLMLTWRFVQPCLKSVWTKQNPPIFLRSLTLQPKRKRYPQQTAEYSAQVSYTLKRL